MQLPELFAGFENLEY